MFYEECLKCFAEISVGSKLRNDQMSNDVASVIIWNNKNIFMLMEDPFTILHFIKSKRV